MIGDSRFLVLLHTPKKKATVESGKGEVASRAASLPTKE